MLLSGSKRLEERACPFCGSREFAIRKRVAKTEVCYNIVTCRRCAFVYVVNPGQTFDDGTINTNITDIPSPRKRHFQIKRLLDIYFANNEEICVLEVGSGYGALAKILDGDSQYMYYGFEPSNNRAQVCKNHGLNVKSDFFSADAVGRSVDAVIIDNVLEHAYEPRKILFEASKVLRHRGLLIVIVPNLHDIRQIWKCWRERHFWRPFDHINYFTVHHLKKAFKDFGFEFQLFGLSPLKIRADLLFFPRALLDTLGVHIFGLNCYGIKLEGENQYSLESANKRRTNTAEFR